MDACIIFIHDTYAAYSSYPREVNKKPSYQKVIFNNDEIIFRECIIQF